MRLRKKRGPNKYSPTYDYRAIQSISNDEIEVIWKEADEFKIRGDKKGYSRTMRKLPMPPNLALLLRDALGKDEFLKCGFNLAEAEVAYGKDWLDEYP